MGIGGLEGPADGNELPVSYTGDGPLSVIGHSALYIR